MGPVPRQTRALWRWQPARLALCLPVLALSACLETGPGPATGLDIPLRNPTAQIASQTGVAAEELDGNWVVRAHAGAVWSRRTVTLDGDGADLRVQNSAVICNGADLCETETGFSHYRNSGPGRWTIEAPLAGSVDFVDEIWLLWADTSRRTIVLGDPGGGWVMILDRAESGGTDRIAAAREVLEWYGYDLTRLEGL